MPGQVTHPVQVLREHTVALEAALTVCLAEPAHKSVHRLRTETRRVEAQLLLLAQISGLPAHRKQTERLRLALKRLRQAAGEVRDLDVHRKRLEEMAEGETQETGEGGEDVDARQQEGGDSKAKAVREGAAALRDHLRSKRDHAASSLQDLLEKHGGKAARAAEKLLAVLEPAEATPLAEAELLRQAEAVFVHSGLLAEGVAADLDEDELHTVRKAAKAARYLAETLPGTDGKGNGQTPGAVAASRFEALQEAGGQWHDALELAKAAKSFLGRRHALTEAIAAERDQNLERYRAALHRAISEAQPGPQPQPKRNGSAAKASPQMAIQGNASQRKRFRKRAPQTERTTKPTGASAAVRRPERIRPTGPAGASGQAA